MDADTAIAVLQERVKFLEGQISAIQCDVRDKFERVEAKLDTALAAIQAGRPTWSIALLIAGLMTVCTGLIVYMATH